MKAIKVSEGTPTNPIGHKVSHFDFWWFHDLSGIPPTKNEDHSEHVYRMCKMVWDRWENVASEIDCHSPEALLEKISLTNDQELDR